jgi:hypothetical protein
VVYQYSYIIDRRGGTRSRVLRSNQDTIVDSDSDDEPESDEDDNDCMQIHDGFEAELEEDEYEHHADE